MSESARLTKARSNGAAASRRPWAVRSQSELARFEPRNGHAAGDLAVVTPEAFTIEEAAHRLGFRHRSSVYDLISRGELVACRLGGGSLRVPADALLDYLRRAVRDAGASTHLCIQRRR